MQHRCGCCRGHFTSFGRAKSGCSFVVHAGMYRSEATFAAHTGTDSHRVLSLRTDEVLLMVPYLDRRDSVRGLLLRSPSSVIKLLFSELVSNNRSRVTKTGSGYTDRIHRSREHRQFLELSFSRVHLPRCDYRTLTASRAHSFRRVFPMLDAQSRKGHLLHMDFNPW